MRKLMAVLAITLAACGGSSDKSGAGSTDAGATYAALLDLQIGLLERCSKANPALYAPTSSFGTRAATVIAFLQAEVTAGRIHFDGTQGAACLAAYRALSCAELSPGGASGGPAIEPAACSATLTGTVALGGTCLVGLDCSNGFCSSDYSLTCPGTCQPFQTAGGNCAAQQCGPGLDCTYDSTTATRVCKVLGAAGAACPCQPDVLCNYSNGRCEPPIAAGGACALSSYGCLPGHQCQGATATTPGTCQPYVAQGGTCAVSSQCGPGYRCVSGTCASWPNLGQDCTGTACLSGYCDSSTALCTPYLADGAPCTTATSWTCLSGSCNAVTLKCERTACRP